MEPVNGSEREPAIRIEWLPEQQGVRLSFDPAQVKNWDFVVALLGMAKDAAEATRRVAQLQQMQQQGREAQQLAALRQSLGR